MCFRSFVCFNITDFYINAIAQECMSLLQHTVRFTYTGTHPDVELKFSSSRFLDQIQKMFGIFSFVHNYCLLARPIALPSIISIALFIPFSMDRCFANNSAFTYRSLLLNNPRTLLRKLSGVIFLKGSGY